MSASPSNENDLLNECYACIDVSRLSVEDRLIIGTYAIANRTQRGPFYRRQLFLVVKQWLPNRNQLFDHPMVYQQVLEKSPYFEQHIHGSGEYLARSEIFDLVEARWPNAKPVYLPCPKKQFNANADLGEDFDVGTIQYRCGEIVGVRIGELDFRNCEDALHHLQQTGRWNEVKPPTWAPSWNAPHALEALIFTYYKHDWLRA